MFLSPPPPSPVSTDNAIAYSEASDQTTCSAKVTILGSNSSGYSSLFFCVAVTASNLTD